MKEQCAVNTSVGIKIDSESLYLYDGESAPLLSRTLDSGARRTNCSASRQALSLSALPYLQSIWRPARVFVSRNIAATGICSPAQRGYQQLARRGRAC